MRLPIQIPEDLYNSGNLDLQTILIIMLSFHGMNIPTMLYKLSADFDNRLMHEAYDDNSRDAKSGD